MMSSMFWFLLLPLFTFVDSEVVNCGVGDATPLRIEVEECENFYYDFDWEVIQREFGQVDEGTFSAEFPDGFENEICLDPSECYFVRLSTYYGNGLKEGGNYTVFYDGTLIFSGSSFENGVQFPKVDSIDFGNGCATSAPSMSSSVMPSSSSSPTITSSMSPTATPTITPTMAPTATPTMAPTAAPTMAPTAAPTMAPTATPTMAPTAKLTMAPTATPKANKTISTSSVGSFDYTAITITVVIASLAVLCVGGW